MSTSHPCRWSEIAEARQFYQAAMLDQPLTVMKEPHPRLGDLIAKIPSCFRRAALMSVFKRSGAVFRSAAADRAGRRMDAQGRRQDLKTPVEQALMRGLDTA